jgi:hypothetical protein
MPQSIAAKFSVVVLLALLATPAAYASCTLLGGASPPISDALVYDYSFDDSGCSAWVASGLASAGYGDGYFENYGPGTLYQDVVIGRAYSSYSLSFDVSMIGSSPGLERLRVEICNTSGSVLETVEILSGSDADGRYDLPIGDYDNQTIRLRLRRASTSFDGDTEFVVHWINIWGMY